MHTDFATLSAAAFLAIPEDRPERLFQGSADNAKKAYRQLAMRWHPDHSRDPWAAGGTRRRQARWHGDRTTCCTPGVPTSAPTWNWCARSDANCWATSAACAWRAKAPHGQP